MSEVESFKAGYIQGLKYAIELTTHKGITKEGIRWKLKVEAQANGATDVFADSPFTKRSAYKHAR